MAVVKKPMTKTEIIKHMVENTELTKAQVINFFEVFNDLAYKETKKKGRFTIHGIGFLKLVKRKARMGRNPATGESLKIPAKTVVKFTLSKVCKDTIFPPKK